MRRFRIKRWSPANFQDVELSIAYYISIFHSGKIQFRWLMLEGLAVSRQNSFFTYSRNSAGIKWLCDTVDQSAKRLSNTSSPSNSFPMASEMKGHGFIQLNTNLLLRTFLVRANVLNFSFSILKRSRVKHVRTFMMYVESLPFFVHHPLPMQFSILQSNETIKVSYSARQEAWRKQEKLPSTELTGTTLIKLFCQSSPSFDCFSFSIFSCGTRVHWISAYLGF